MEEGSDQVYAMRNPSNGHIKIGVSRSPMARLREAQTWIPEVELLAAGGGGYRRERWLHRQLAGHRINDSEWFAASDDVMRQIAELPSWDESCTLPTMLTPAQREQLLDAKTVIDEGRKRHQTEDAERTRRLAEVIAGVYEDGETTHQEIADEIGLTKQRVTQLIGMVRRRDDQGAS